MSDVDIALFYCFFLEVTKKKRNFADERLNGGKDMNSIALDTNIYNRATVYAKRHKTSLAEIIESYLKSLISTEVRDKTETREKIEKKLEEIIALPANWDKEQAMPISPKVGKEALNVLNECQDYQLENLAIFPNRSGNIFMQWETKKGDACLAISTKGLSYNVSIGDQDLYGKLSYKDKNTFLNKLNQIL